MKKFQFSLETLHMLRMNEEREKEQILARFVGELARIEKEIIHTFHVVDEAFSRSATTLDVFQSRERILTKALKDRERLKHKKAIALQKVDNARKIYEEALVKRKSLDRLQDKRFGQWKKFVQNRETAYLDEVAKNGSKYEW